jgi:hypothetical protein
MEEAKTADLATKLGKVYDHTLLLHLPQSQKCAYKYKTYPTLHGKVGTRLDLVECCQIDCKDRDLVVLLSKRGRRLDELYGNLCLDALDFLHVLDVGHALWQFSRAGIMHADVKAANMLVVDHLGKLIDFGFSMSYADLLKGNHSPLMGEATHYNYPYWPGVLRELVGFDEKMAALGKSMDDEGFDLTNLGPQLLELLESTDKHGFAQTLVSKATAIIEKGTIINNPTWDMFKDLSTTRSVECHNKSEFAKHDPHMDNPFFSWPTIFDNLKDYAQKALGVKVAPLDEDYLAAMRPVKSKLEEQLSTKLQKHEQEIAAYKAQQAQKTARQVVDTQEHNVVEIGDEHEEDVLQEGAKQTSTMQEGTMQKGTMQKSATPKRIQSSRAMPPPSVLGRQRKTKRSDTPTPSRRTLTPSRRDTPNPSRRDTPNPSSRVRLGSGPPTPR